MMKRRDALKGLSFLGLLSALGTTGAVIAEAPVATSPHVQVPEALRPIFEGMQMVGRIKALSEPDQRRLIARLRADEQGHTADWVARVCSRRA